MKQRSGRWLATLGGLLALVMVSCTSVVPPPDDSANQRYSAHLEAPGAPQPGVTVPGDTAPPDTTAPGDTSMPTGTMPTEAGDSEGVLFRETFTNDPASPESQMNDLPGWFAQPIMQGTSGWDLAPEPMDAQHDMTCAPPPATHRITTYEESVYSCKNHLMTAMNPPSHGTANGVITLQPDHLVDLSGGSARVSVDVSTLSPSAGDWWEIWITPPEDALVAPSDHWFHQAGPPRRALHFKVFDSGPIKRWQGKAFDNYAYAGGVENTWEAAQIQNIVTRSDTRRDTYEVRIDGNTVRMLVENHGSGELVQVDEFDFREGLLGDSAVVQFVHASYEPEKNGKVGCTLANCPDITSSATWHWDNAEIEPAIPYTLIGVRPWQVWSGSDSNRIDLDAPAPSDAEMVFVAFSKGNAPEMSFDGGATWTRAEYVRGPNDPSYAGWGGDPDLLTYRVPVPAGATSALVRGRDICSTCAHGQRWAAQNFHVVAPRA